VGLSGQIVVFARLEEREAAAQEQRHHPHAQSCALLLLSGPAACITAGAVHPTIE
ncbi:MAG: hypothetical protein ACI9WU_000187, partial [Myxococcota bacterium]